MEKININERFEMLYESLEMILSGEQASLILAGEGGIGKTYAVKKFLLDKGLTEASPTEDGEFTFVKGAVTAVGLFDIIEDYNGKIIVFDDCDSVWADKDAVNILKGGLDTHDERIIKWRNKNGARQVNFTGQIIFITNRKVSSLDKPVRSRSMVIDLDMDSQDKLDRINLLLPKIIEERYPDMDIKIIQDFITHNIDNIPNFNMRSVLTTLKIASRGSENWQKHALFVIKNS